MYTEYLLGSAFFICSSVHLFACFFVKEKIRKTTKVLIMPLLLLLYLNITANSNDDLIQKRTKLVANGMLLGFQGDFLLLFENEKCFVIGLVSFLAGHFLYIFAIARTIKDFLNIPFLIFINLSFSIISKIIAEKYVLPKRKFDFFLLLMYSYVFTLSILNSFSLYFLIYNRSIAAITLFSGTFLFLISDAILSRNAFVSEIKNGRFLVMLTYISAQTLIALSMTL